MFAEVASTVVTIQTFDNGFETIQVSWGLYMVGLSHHSIFLGLNSLGFLFQKLLGLVLEFPGLPYIFHELACLDF